MQFLIFLLSIVRTVILAYVASYLWSVFAAPLGAPWIGPLHAWGLVGLVQLTRTSRGSARSCSRT